jgi:hypothetical protein
MGIDHDSFDLAQTFGADGAWPDDLCSGVLTRAAAHPAGGRNFAHRLEGRLAELMEGAIASHSIARQYLRTARGFVAEARRARRGRDRSRFEAHLREARKAHDQARKCLSFARLCRLRAECLAAIADYPIKLKE